MKTSTRTRHLTKLIGCCLLLFAFGDLSAQTWQWGKSGGTTDSFNTLTEEVKSACTDIYGNVYIVSDVASTNSQIDGVPKQYYNMSFGLRDGILASFSCSGAYRWSKVIGGGYTDFVNCVQSDALGNIYVLGQVDRGGTQPTEIPAHFDTDLTLPSSANNVNENKQSVFIIKYNNEGVFQWLRMPEPPNVSTSQTLTYTNTQDLQVDAQGNSYSLCHLPIGVYADGAYPVTISGLNILKYDPNGVFLGGIPIDIQFANPRGLARMRRNHQTGNFYVAAKAYQSGFPSEYVTINGELQTKAVFIAAFNSVGTFLWKKENLNPSASSDYLPGIAIDPDNNIYMATSTGPVNLGNGNYGIDSFNGTPIAATVSFQVPLPFIVKMDANGNNLWLTSANRTFPTDLILNGEEITTCGTMYNTTWQNLSFTSQNSSKHAYIARFNKNSGNIIAINTIGTTASDNGNALAIDSKGNYYLGGSFTATMTAGSSTLVNSGGDEDFFIAKFGTTDCDFLAAEEFDQDVLRGYPNPVRGLFHLNNQESANYVLYDVLGAKIQSGAISQQGSIDLSIIASGLYLLQLQTVSGKTQMVKLVKE